jgi:hypothetical protein
MGRRHLTWVLSIMFVVALAVSMLVEPSVVLATGDANETHCGAEVEASTGFRTYLPDCRAFELVTPPYKEGGVVVAEPGAVSVDGSHVIAESGGAFAGADNDWWDLARNSGAVAYELTRTATGWQPEVLTPPAAQYPHSVLMAVSAEDFGTTLWGAAPTDLLYNENIYLRTDGGEFRLVGPGTGPEVAGKEELFLLASEELGFVGASRNLSHSLFEVRSNVLSGHSTLWPGDTTKIGEKSLYEYVYNIYTGAPDAEPTLVGVANEGTLKSDTEAHLISNCGTELGSGEGNSEYNAVSENGESVFFTARECPGGPAVNELYARIAGTSTVNISEPSEEDCKACDTTTAPGGPGASFQGASQAGEKAFFLTEQELLPGQAGKNLYEYDFNSPVASPEHPDGKISLVSGGSADPEVEGVVRVSENGERVYFVARGVLSGKDRVAGRSPEEAQPQPGADNLYVYEPDPAHPGSYHTVFVATLLTHGEEEALAGEEGTERATVNELAEDAGKRAFEEATSRGIKEHEAREIGEEIESQQRRVLGGTLGPAGTLGTDEGLWGGSDRRPAQATPNGEFLVFLSSADLTAEDKSAVPQLFEYDVRGESLTRVSIGQGGPSSGNVDTFQESPRIPEQRFNGGDPPNTLPATTSGGLAATTDSGLAVSEDGSEVFFASAATLAPQAKGGATNVYEYREGDIYMVSGGNDASSFGESPTVGLFGIAPGGRDVFFTTASQLVPQGGETQMALYDARDEGGFPASVLETGCIGETCRGPSGAAAQSLSPGSTGQGGGGNVFPPTSPSAVAKPKPKAAAKRCRNGFVRRKGKCVRKPRSRKAEAKKAGDRRRSGS